MNAPIPRERLERFHRLLTEYRRRAARKEQSQRGWYDDDGVRQGGLMAFIRYFWHVLEPETELVEGWALYAIVEHLEAVTFGEIKRLLITVPPGFMKSLCTDVFWPAWEWGPMDLAHLRYVAFSYSASLTERDNERFRDLIVHESYQALWGRKVRPVKIGATKITNTRKGWKLASSVGGVGTGERGDRIVLDDAHNIKEAESEIVRQETVRWFRESMSDRLNNLRLGVIVVIMQRAHEDDVAGAILSLGLPYCHLMIPMEFDWSRQTDEDGEARATEIGWTDPRFVPLQPEVCDGTLAWPERFPAHEVGEIRTIKGPYAYCTPHEAPILLADLSFKPIGEIKEGDEIIGFDAGDTTVRPHRRRKLCRSTVLSISRSVQKLVKMTLDSGRVIRCTPDHKWYTGRNDASHRLYAPARVGTALMRICPPDIPELSPDDQRRAGWLAGFFDGEGSVAFSHRRAGSCGALISFAQGAGRNLPLCEKLEEALTHFGFEFGYREGIRQDRRDKENAPPSRWYWIRAGDGKRAASTLPTYQRFLHVIQPAKWRDRIAEGALVSRFVSGEERVVSIEDDGEETVFGLETTTGNYVVWGLASSNSGQYQQSPAPRGGGIFQRDWWQLWESPDGKFPVFEYMLASLDSAFTDKESNDPSGLTIWGIFTKEGQRRIMLVHAWRKHLQFSGPRIDYLPRETPQAYRRRTMESWGLMEWVSDTANRFKVDKLLIEAKASGISAAQELRNRYGLQDWAVQLCPVKGDKVARALAVQPTFSQLMVYAPARDWAEMVIDEAATFPKGKYADLTDSLTQAMKYLRDTGLAQTDAEVSAADADRVTHRSQLKAIYPV